MRHYVYIDSSYTELLFSQIPEEERTARVVKKQVGLSITGPNVSYTEEPRGFDRALHEKIEKVTEFLAKSGSLALHRPQDMREPEEDVPFVYEETEACKVIFPSKLVAEIIGKGELGVWVSDPDPSQLSNEKWDWRGTFLYLTQARFDDLQYRTVWSGYSALQALVNAVSGGTLFIPRDRWGEPLGRGSYEHPVKKLVGLGCHTTGEVRPIATLYRKRYITDEQCYAWNGEPYRVNDLLGYPLYIAEPSVPVKKNRQGSQWLMN